MEKAYTYFLGTLTQETSFHFACLAGLISPVRDIICEASKQVERGHTNSLLHLLERRLTDLRLTPLHFCILGAKLTTSQTVQTYGTNQEMLPFEAIIDELCLAGARVDSRDITGHTPLALLTIDTSVNQLNLVEALLKHGADPNTRCDVEGQCSRDQLKRKNPLSFGSF